MSGNVVPNRMAIVARDPGRRDRSISYASAAQAQGPGDEWNPLVAGLCVAALGDQTPIIQLARLERRQPRTAHPPAHVS